MPYEPSTASTCTYCAVFLFSVQSAVSSEGQWYQSRHKGILDRWAVEWINENTIEWNDNATRNICTSGTLNRPMRIRIRRQRIAKASRDGRSRWMVEMDGRDGWSRWEVEMGCRDGLSRWSGDGELRARWSGGGADRQEDDRFWFQLLGSAIAVFF